MSKKFMPALPFSLSLAPAPMSTEAMMANMTRFIERSGRTGDSLEEMNQLLLSPKGQQAINNIPPESPREEAQQMVMGAWSLQPPTRYEWAKQALTIDPHCSDAYLILAETTSTWRKQRRYFEQAVAACDAWIGPYQETLKKEGAPASLYGIVETRPWFRSKMALARILYEGGFFSEALDIYNEMLKWDPEDHLAVRYDLIELFHDQDDIDRLVALLDQFAEDTTTFMAYERLWVAVYYQSDDMLEQLNHAYEANPYFVEVITNRVLPSDSPYLTVGSVDEAAAYFDMAVPWWLKRQDILAWVVTHWPRT
ncbi:tetratricopeptide repeat protein [Sulfobacillus thermosulfidooxidans]|uniref:tetratricopeptide repeat protein n=1 Tax=Sulfobacillus thermosulfidooxidans TaxID=28034 RepID=UPI0006B5E74F|nr:hypothetical protein [Sulfobacillus thermosulfidooxidans]